MYQVMARLPKLPAGSPDDIDMGIFIRSLFFDGFSVDDAVAYCQCMEEFNPTLEEDVALERMDKLREKYKKGDLI